MKWPIPAPTNFSEGQRALYGCLVAFAGIFAGLVCLLFIAIFFGGVVKHVWSEPQYVQIITILGYGFGGFIVAMVAVILTLAIGGPVGRFKGGASLQNGVNLDVASDASASTMSTTTTTTVVAPPPPQPPVIPGTAG